VAIQDSSLHLLGNRAVRVRFSRVAREGLTAGRQSAQCATAQSTVEFPGNYAFIRITARYSGSMSLVRILVDGYSLLHHWPALAPGRPRHSAAAREELVHALTRYQDAVGTPITIFFDGSGAPPNAPKPEGTRSLEVLFSGPGQTADDLIERATHRFQPYGPVMAVTNDLAERDIVTGLGGHACSCENFIRLVEGEMEDFQESLKRYNRTEQNRYRHTR